MKKDGIIIGLVVHIQVTAIKQNEAQALIGVVKLMVKTWPESPDEQQGKRVQVPELSVDLVWVDLFFIVIYHYTHVVFVEIGRAHLGRNHGY